MEIEVKAGIELCKRYVLPLLLKIAKSAISNFGKSTYEKFYNKFMQALKSYGEAIVKMTQADDVETLKKRLACCELGYKFFERIKNTLDDVLVGYQNALSLAEARFQDLGGDLEEIRKEVA